MMIISSVNGKTTKNTTGRKGRNHGLGALALPQSRQECIHACFKPNRESACEIHSHVLRVVAEKAMYRHDTGEKKAARSKAEKKREKKNESYEWGHVFAFRWESNS